MGANALGDLIKPSRLRGVESRGKLRIESQA